MRCRFSGGGRWKLCRLDREGWRELPTMVRHISYGLGGEIKCLLMRSLRMSKAMVVASTAVVLRT